MATIKRNIKPINGKPQLSPILPGVVGVVGTYKHAKNQASPETPTILPMPVRPPSDEFIWDENDHADTSEAKPTIPQRKLSKWDNSQWGNTSYPTRIVRAGFTYHIYYRGNHFFPKGTQLCYVEQQ